MSNDLKPYEKWMKDQLKDVDVPDINQAWEQMSNLLQPGIANIPSAPHKPWFGKWWFVGSVIVVATTAILFTKKHFKNTVQKQQVKNNIVSNSKSVDDNKQNDIEFVNGSSKNKLSDSINTKTKKEENRKENISLKNEVEIENKVATKDKNVASNINSKNKLIPINKEEEKRNIVKNKKYKQNENASLQKDVLKNTYTKSNKDKVISKSTSVIANNDISKSSTKKYRNKNQFNRITYSLKKSYATSNINKNRKIVKPVLVGKNTISNISNSSTKEANAEKQLKNVRYNVSSLNPTALALPNPTIININQPFSVLSGKQLAFSMSKKWSTRIGATINAPFAFGGREYDDNSFSSRDGAIINFIPSLSFNIKYTFKPKWSIGFAPQFFVQQVPYSNALSAIINSPLPTDPNTKFTKIVRIANMYYSHFPLAISYQLLKKIELQAGIDLAILNKVIAYKNEKYESPTQFYSSEKNSTSLTQEELRTLRKFDIRALLGITFNLTNSWHLGVQVTQAFGSYLKKELAPALSSDPVAGEFDPLPTKSTNASLQFFTRYDFNILKKNKKKENHQNILTPNNSKTANSTNEQQASASQGTLAALSSSNKKWSARVGLAMDQPIAIGFGTPHPEYNIALNGQKNQLLNYIPSPHINIKYQFSRKWSITFSPEFYVRQLTTASILDYKPNIPVPDGSGDTMSINTILGKAFYSHFPLSINYNINRKIEAQLGIDVAVLHNAVGYNEINYFHNLGGYYKTEVKNTTLRNSQAYQALRTADVRVLAGATYHINKNLHFGMLFTQAFTSYLKSYAKFDPPVTSFVRNNRYSTASAKNVSLQLFLKYDFDVLKKKKLNNKN